MVILIAVMLAPLRGMKTQAHLERVMLYIHKIIKPGHAILNKINSQSFD